LFRIYKEVNIRDKQKNVICSASTMEETPVFILPL
jgi:hypothetical protein